MRTLAPGITAPVESVTVPRTAPALPLCAGTESAANSKAKTGIIRKIAPLLNFMGKPPDVDWKC
jgi:hypothetical protein